MKFPSLPGWHRASPAASPSVSNPAQRRGSAATSADTLLPRAQRPPAQGRAPGPGLPQPAGPQSPPRPVRDTATLDKLATLLHRPAADPAGPSGDGWGMAFLRKSEQRQALFDMADDPHVAPLDLMKLLSRKPDLNATDEDGKTVLLRAACALNAMVVQALADRGADVRAADHQGLTALHMAAFATKEEPARSMVSALLAAGADVHAQALGMTPLFAANSQAAVDLLLEAGAAIDPRGPQGNTPLTYAAAAWRPHAMLALLERGADPTATNDAGDSCIDLVRDHYRLDEHAALPSEPAALADYIARREVEPDTGLPMAARVPAPAVAAAPGRPINSLPSGHKIALVERPHARIGELGRRDINALSQALGFGPLSNSAEEEQAQCVALWKTLDAFAQDALQEFDNHDNEVLKHPGLLSGLSEAEQKDLEAAMATAHMFVAAERDLRGRFIMPCRLKIFFGGTQNFTDVKHDVRSGFGLTSSVDRAARRIGELLARQMASEGNQIQIERIAGGSMGGATAQTTLATLQSHVQLAEQPSMLLLDPQLLNNRQAARATRDGSLAVDFQQPRGVAISLDYTKAPHRGLMGIMKGPGGYTYPGLVHLKLGLADTDGVEGTVPQTSGPPGLGYHADLWDFGRALARFTGVSKPPEEGPPGPQSSPVAAQASVGVVPAGPGEPAASVPELLRSSRRRPKEPDALHAVAEQWQAGTGPPSFGPVPAALGRDELAHVRKALGGEGLALRRMNERAARAGGVVARMGFNAPQPLQGSRRADFAALVERDLARLIESPRIDRRLAADLLLRAVHSGQMGATLRPDDKALLLEVLAEAKT